MASGRAHESAARRAVGETLRWVDDNELVRPLVVGILVVMALAAFVVAGLVRSGEPNGGGVAAAPPTAPPPARDEPSRTTAYENLFGGYAFAYPDTWRLIESGAVAHIKSPNGRLVLSFGLASGPNLAAGSDRTVDTIVQGWADQELTGTTHERIAGSRSLLVGGMISEGEARMRFLAITVRARPRNYAISILAPRAADPERVLPVVEEIVASFEILRLDEPTAA